MQRIITLIWIRFDIIYLINSQFNNTSSNSEYVTSNDAYEWITKWKSRKIWIRIANLYAKVEPGTYEQEADVLTNRSWRHWLRL